MLRKTSLSVMAFTYFFAGLYHFLRFDYFVNLTPSFIPEPSLFTRLAGFLLVLISLLLAWDRTRKGACWTILVLLIGLSIPINIISILKGGAGIPLPHWQLVARIPFQLGLALWATWHLRDPKGEL